MCLNIKMICKKQKTIKQLKHKKKLPRIVGIEFQTSMWTNKLQTENWKPTPLHGTTVTRRTKKRKQLNGALMCLCFEIVMKITTTTKKCGEEINWNPIVLKQSIVGVLNSLKNIKKKKKTFIVVTSKHNKCLIRKWQVGSFKYDVLACCMQQATKKKYAKIL